MGGEPEPPSFSGVALQKVPPVTDVFVRRSEDGGYTWAPTLTVCDFGDTCGNPVPMQDDRGRVHLLLSRNPSDAGETTAIPKRSVWSAYSDDAGSTWSEPRD